VDLGAYHSPPLSRCTKIEPFNLYHIELSKEVSLVFFDPCEWIISFTNSIYLHRSFQHSWQPCKFELFCLKKLYFLTVLLFNSTDNVRFRMFIVFMNTCSSQKRFSMPKNIDLLIYFSMVTVTRFVSIRNVTTSLLKSKPAYHLEIIVHWNTVSPFSGQIWKRIHPDCSLYVVIAITCGIADCFFFNHPVWLSQFCYLFYL